MGRSLSFFAQNANSSGTPTARLKSAVESDLPNKDVVGKLDSLTMSSLRPQFVRYLCRKFLSLALLAAIVLLVPEVCSAQKSQEWLPLTAQDWKINSVPGDPGAAEIGRASCR